MEAIAAAASIAGIITVAAQAIDGLQTLHNFFTDISSASKTVSRLLSDINSLIAVLHNIDNVLHQVERQREDQNFAQLDIKVDDCTKDVKIWLETAKDLRPAGDKGGRAWVRRARLAAKGEVVGRIREEIGRHKQALCLSLAVFGRSVVFPFSSYLCVIVLAVTCSSSSSISIRIIHDVAKLMGFLELSTYTLRIRFIRCAADSMMR